MTANTGGSGEGATGAVKKNKVSESRKIRKPLMEKRRRARINESLNELKRILLEANGAPTRKEGSRPAKLEKADILELTVRHLQSLSTQQLPNTNQLRVTSTSSSSTCGESDEEDSSSMDTSPLEKDDPIILSSSENSRPFVKGFAECIRFVNNSLQTLERNKSSGTPLIQELNGLLKAALAELYSARESANYHSDEKCYPEKTLLLPTKMPNGEIGFVLGRCSKNCCSNSSSNESNWPMMRIKSEPNSPNSMSSSDSYYLCRTNLPQNVIWRPW